MSLYDIIFQNQKYCKFCGNNEIYQYDLCEDCLDRLDQVDNHAQIMGTEVFYPYFYNGILKEMLHEYKFNRKTVYAHVFAKMIIDFDRRKNIFSKFDYVLTSPLHISKRRSRGFDHIKLILDLVSKEIDIDYVDGFYKIKRTKMQHMLNKDQRTKNLTNAFKFKNYEKYKDSSILIFDDIITTGNTLKTIRKTLEKKNIKKISAMAITSTYQINNSNK